MYIRILFIVLVVFTGNFSIAGEKAVVCAKYKKNYSWSKGYQVEANIMTGNELNQATKTFNYSGFSKYVVIFWDKDEVSIIELDMPYLSALEQKGEDQQGRKWKVSKSSLCI